jgi:hypothetical protein
MTEKQWRTCTAPLLMLEHLGGASPRKLRLFAVACCRRIEHYLIDPRSRQLIDLSEQYADGLIPDQELSAGGQAAGMAAEDVHWEGGGAVEQSSAETVMGLREQLYVDWVANKAAETMGDVAESDNDNEEDDSFEGGAARERSAQVDLVRDIFGNPFRPVVLDPRWLTANAVDLARTIYEERAFERLPILADALMDAGCADEALLAHCRGPGPHVRGCWVADLLLGKK